MKKISKSAFANWIEEDGKHYIAIGEGAPWNRDIWIRVPKWFAKIIGG